MKENKIDNIQNKELPTSGKSKKKVHFSQKGNLHKFDKIKISVVIPLLNEEESLPELSNRLAVELTRLANDSYEVIFIDDGSTDNSFEVIKNINANNPKFQCVRFRRNYGKSAALSVGFARAKGEYVITMDADLQDDPSEIEHLIKKLEEGYDLVSGWKKKRYDPISKTLPSKLFNWATSKVAGIKLHDFNCGLKGYRNEVVKSLNVYGEMHRYLPALANWMGFRVTEMVVQHHPRKYGYSKFGLSRFINGFLDLLTVLLTTKYFKRPLHFFGAVGSFVSFVGFVILMYLIVEWLLGLTYLSNRPLTLFAIGMIIVGVQFLSIGLLGEMLVKTNNENSKRLYGIKEILK
ncbi:MAG TPA: glycosyltransferase family 2 protein [Candidatus Kapabacteria bacterium]|nr:glycosyltransferase family 2 protein [Candidatus Kapabacteria bacterium]